MKSGQWFVLGAAILWGTTGTAQAFAPVGAEPTTIGALRLIVGGAFLLAWVLPQGGISSVRQLPLLTTVLAAGSMAAYQVFFFTAVLATGVAIGTIVAIGSAPIVAGLLTFLSGDERPGYRWLLATILAVIGCTLLVVRGGEVSVNPLGVALALGAGASYATYTVVSKRLLTAAPPDTVAAVVFCLAAIFLTPILFMGDLTWLTEPRGLGVALHLGLFATALAYILFTRGLLTTPVPTAVTLSLAEPVTAALLGVLVLGEQLTLAATIGISFVLSGLAILALKRRQPEGRLVPNDPLEAD